MKKILISASLPALLLAFDVNATVILSPTAISQNTLGNRDANVDIGNVIDQSGLSSAFTSGVTDFDTYLGGNPTHSLAAGDNEWFAPDGEFLGFIDFDLGAVYDVDRVAIWNEDAAGVSRFELITSLDATFAASTSFGFFSLTNNPRDVDYLADVISLGAVSSARYVRMSIEGFYPDEQNFADQASLGEVAFSVTAANDVPEPASLVLGGLGLLAAGTVGRRRG